MGLSLSGLRDYLRLLGWVGILISVGGLLFSFVEESMGVHYLEIMFSKCLFSQALVFLRVGFEEGGVQNIRSLRDFNFVTGIVAVQLGTA